LVKFITIWYNCWFISIFNLPVLVSISEKNLATQGQRIMYILIVEVGFAQGDEHFCM
jgi:hypothetical protein